MVTQRTTTYHTDSNMSARLGKATGRTNEESSFDSQQEQNISLFSLGTTEPPNWHREWCLSLTVKRLGHEATHSPHPVPWLTVAYAQFHSATELRGVKKDNFTSVYHIIPVVVNVEPIYTFKCILVKEWYAPMSRQHKKYDFKTEHLQQKVDREKCRNSKITSYKSNKLFSKVIQ